MVSPLHAAASPARSALVRPSPAVYDLGFRV